MKSQGGAIRAYGVVASTEDDGTGHGNYEREHKFFT